MHFFKPWVESTHKTTCNQTIWLYYVTLLDGKRESARPPHFQIPPTMPRPSRAAKNSKTTPPDPQSSSPIDTQTPELQSTETQQAGPELAFNTAKTKQKKRKAGQEDHTDDEFPSREKSRKKMAAKISPLAFRNKGMKMLVGAHVSVAKGLEKVPLVRTTGILISFLENRGSERNHKQSQHWGKRIRNVPQIAQKMDQSGSERI